MGILKKITKKDEAKAAEKKTASSAKPKKAAEKQTETPKAAAVNIAAAHGILVRPLLSEKMNVQEQQGQYSFEVTPKATKIDVKRAIENVYGVRPAKVNIMHVEGKRTRYGRLRGRRSGVKKAIVILPKGRTISIHEGV